jgi:hypothetical protein
MYFLSTKTKQGCLPLILMSDLPVGLELEMEQVQNVMTSMKVTVSTRPKNKNGILHRTLVIRGTERDAERLFEARRILLGMPRDTRISCQVPESYKIPPTPPSVPLQQPLPIHSMPSGPNPYRYSPEPASGLLGWYPPTPSAAQSVAKTSFLSPNALPYPYLPQQTTSDNSQHLLGSMINGWNVNERSPVIQNRNNNAVMRSRQASPFGKLYIHII